jgi:hypothetical protein
VGVGCAACAQSARRTDWPAIEHNDLTVEDRRVAATQGGAQGAAARPRWAAVMSGKHDDRLVACRLNNSGSWSIRASKDAIELRFENVGGGVTG